MATGQAAVLEDYQRRARVGKRLFVAQHPHLFLVRAAAVVPAVDEWSDPMDFDTRVEHDAGDPDADSDPLWTHDGGLIIAPVVKRAGGPYPERFGVGRARNCDVVVRFPAVSKLHALFELGPPLTLLDLGSANGTRVNGEQLLPRVPRAVAVGDRIALGPVELELLDAAALFELLAA